MFSKDTIKYQGRTYAVGDTITLGYGSKSNKDFAFITIGGLLTGVEDLGRHWAKNEAVIEKVYKNNKQTYMKAKLVDKTINAIGGNKLYVDLEGAVDNKEIK